MAGQATAADHAALGRPPGMFDRAAAAAGLTGLTPHEPRHTAASLAVSAGPT